MTATIVNDAADSVTLQIVILFNRLMLEVESAIQDALLSGGNPSISKFSS